MKKKILTIIGTRPNYIKVTQFGKEFSKHSGLFDYRLLHTGQHYDQEMKDIFFTQLGLQKMDYALDANRGTPDEQIRNIISGTVGVLQDWKPDLMIVVGDVNSTLAASIAANRCDVKLAHVESGLRSFDRTMPEEFNRIVTDRLADFCFVTEESGVRNLLREGKKMEQIFLVGNTMIDTLMAFDHQFDQSSILKQLGLKEKEYVLMTIHRPSNVDEVTSLSNVISLISHVASKYKVVFPIHPRTRKNLSLFSLKEKTDSISNLIMTDPLDYVSFQKLIRHCQLVITDSGGIQEETTFRKIPCLTLRPGTERPVTVDLGTNELLPFDPKVIDRKIKDIETGNYKRSSIPPLWDGNATSRIVEVLRTVL